MGKDLLDTLAAAGITPKKRTVDSVRGKAFKASSGGEYLVTYSPAMTAIDSAKTDEIAWDIRLAERLVRTGQLKPETGTYRWVQDFSELVSAIECTYAKTGKPVTVGGDTETLGLQPYDGAPLVAVGFTDRARFADCLHLHDIQTEAQAIKVIETLQFLLTSPKVKMVGANFKFDMMWFGVRLQVECTNFAFDTLLAGSLLDENRSNSLNNHAKIYTTMGGYDDAFNDKYDKSRMDLVPKADMLEYLGGDVDAVFRSATKIREELLAVPALANFYINLLHPAALTFGRMERRGILGSPERFEALRVELEGQDGKGGALGALDEKAISLLPARIRMKYADDLSMNRGALLKDYFFSPLGLNLKPLVVTPKTGEPSTSKTHLSMFYDRPEAKMMVETMAARGSASKVLTTYVKGFLKHLRSDGYFHPSYMLFAGKLFDNDNDDSGTNTGRTSAKDPAIQTVPKRGEWAKKLRQCFPAPPGMAYWSTDCMQGELKIAACLSNEENMLAAYLAGLDLHAVTGASMMDMEYEEFMLLSDDVNNKEQMGIFELGRYRAKAANFGLLYEMQAAGFVRYAWATFKMILTLDQAQDIIDKFFTKYPGLLDWHAAYKSMAKRDGYICNPFGRVRHLPLIHSSEWHVAGKAQRQAINAPVQSSLSEITCWALTNIDKYVGQAQAVAMIHDAGLGYAPEDQIEEVGRRIVEVASTLPIKETFGWDHQLQFTFDLEIGPDMGSMTKVKIAA